MNYNRKQVSCALIHEESFKIPIETEEGVIELEAKLIKSDYTPQNLAPCVITCHGWRGNLNGFRYIQYPLALCGYAIVTYSSRGHGKSGGKVNFQQIYEDIIRVIDYLEKNNNNFGIDTNRIAVIGHSMGANVALMKPYQDARVKMVVGVSGMHELKESYEKPRKLSAAFLTKVFVRTFGRQPELTDEINRAGSPKYYLSQPGNAQVLLIHAKDDKIVRFHNFEENVAFFQLPPDHTLVFEKGGHSLYHLEGVILAQIIKWIDQYL
jgi:pimeloyl-ACP methyl ester carboxylesterase